MTSPSNRKAINHLIRNSRHRDQNKEIILNIDDIEPKLDQIITAVGHTVIDIANSTVIIGGTTVTFPAVDITSSNGIFEFEMAGTLGHANMDFNLEVSQNNIDWYPFPTVFTIMGTSVSSTFDMVFRYHRIKVTNNTGANYSVQFIESGRH